jgi:hypothetical protein
MKMNTIVKIIMWIIGLFVVVGPWVYHLVYCFKQQEYILLLVGGIIPPIGWIHGLGAFLGWW